MYKLDDLTIQIGSENVDGALFGDVYYLNYHGINVFFYVCRTSMFKVCIFELSKKKIKYEGKTVDVLCDGLKPTKSPKVILDNNCCYKSDFWVSTTKDGAIEIFIDSSLPLYKQAIKEGVEFPETGPVYAYKLKEELENGILNYYWDIRSNKKIKQN